MKIVVTAGPTREPIDPVRFLSNRSSGKMGYALAEAALETGHEVTLISGPTALHASGKRATGSHHHRRRTLRCGPRTRARLRRARDVRRRFRLQTGDSATQKMEKQTGEFALRLTPTRDILASLPTKNRSCFVVGFAAETHDIEASARRKLSAKHCDMIVANDVSAQRFRNGKRRERGDNFRSRRRNEINFARSEKKYRARAHENNFSDA